MELRQISDSLRFNCQNHKEQPLNLFCDDDQCTKKGLICGLCQLESHNHGTSSLKIILRDIHKDLTEFNTGKLLVLIAAQIDNEFHKCLLILQTIKNRQDAAILQDSITHYFKKLKDMLLKPKASEVIQLIASAKKKFLLAYRTQNKNNKPNQDESNYIFSLNEVISQLGNKYSDLQKGISSEQKLQALLQIYMILAYAPKIVYTFNPAFKHTSQTITNNGTLVTQNNNYNTNLIMLHPSIQGAKSYGMKTKTVNIKITKLTSWISVGVCHQNIVKNAQYYFNTGSIGHGAYVISNDGYTWHHSNTALNSYYNGWTFEQGDTITILVNPRSKTIKFHKLNAPQNFYEFAYETIPGDKLYFCASLSSHNESVQVINN